tara:strand:- start:1689 stop:3833 length:2145 start_codon:yes stop_codon:yes gene_type:complete
MAEVLLSPGVLASETDQSFLSAQPVQAGAAILGPTVKGPVGLPTLVTTYSEYQNKFGAVVESGSAEYTYFTSIAAYNYFQQGGDSLLVTRIVSGSYTTATSSKVENGNTATPGATASGDYTYNVTEPGTSVEGISIEGLQGNPIDGNAGTKIFLSASSNNAFIAAGIYYYTGAGQGLVDSINTNLGGVGIFNYGISASWDNVGGVVTLKTKNVGVVGNDIDLNAGSQVQLYAGTATKELDLSGGVDATFSNTFTLETISEGTDQNSTGSEGAAGNLANGTRDNIRWEVVSPNTASGTFSLLIRRGDDITTSKTVLETWADLSLDPNAPNYIEKAIGNSKQTVTQDAGTGEYYVKNEGTYNTLSNYVRVKSVESKTLNYFDNAGNPRPEYVDSIPLAQSGTLGDAEGTAFDGITANFYENIDGGVTGNTQGLVDDNYTISINLLSNRDEYQYNLIVAPGLTMQSHSSPLASMIDISQQRGDNLSIVDLRDWGSGINSVTAGASAIDSSYAATYWPWLQTIDPDLGQQVWVPASTMMPGVFAFNDTAGEAWFAPAGLSRGGMSTVLRAERKLTNGNRDTLYQANVNPIATFPNTGVVVFGQKTLQSKASALDRVNVRRLLIALKNYISQIANNLVFEQNTIATRNNFLSQVNPYLSSVQQRQGLYAFKVVMDDSNNTPDVIDRNQLIGQIYIQPTKTAEFIYLDFNILPTGATFPA